MTKHRNKKIHPKDIHHLLGGLIFPIFQTEIIEYVRGKGASTGIMDIFSNLPRKDYENENEILNTLHIPGHLVTANNVIKIVTITTIPGNLPKFEKGDALFIVAGRQEAILYRASKGSIESIFSHKVPNVHYSDKEGHFKVRYKGLVIRSGAVKEPINNKVSKEFIEDFKQLVKKEISPKEFMEVYIFALERVKSKILTALPAILRKKVVYVMDGDYFRMKPLALIKKIAGKKPQPVVPIKPEAKKIIDKSKQARTIIKGRG